MNWLKYRFLYFAISLLVIIPGGYSLVRYGLNLAVDFTGGSVLELKLDGQLTRLERPPLTQEEVKKIKQEYQEKYQTVEEISFTSVGPAIGRQTLIKTLVAVGLAAAGILLYIAYAFKSLKFGLAALLATLHDTLVLLGSFSLLGHFFDLQVDLLFVTAVLTTLSFSVHDTIVVFDRIRELAPKNRDLSFSELANKAISQTLVRSINNSLTIVFMLTALVFLGGDTIRDFALALLIGAITGTYSSPFVAVPLLSLWP